MAAAARRLVDQPCNHTQAVKMGPGMTSNDGSLVKLLVRCHCRCSRCESEGFRPRCSVRPHRVRLQRAPLTTA